VSQKKDEMRILQPNYLEILKYGSLTFGGLAIDIATSILLVYFVHFPIIVAGAFGLLMGAAANYFIHLKITFKDRLLATSWKGYFKYLQTCMIGAAFRLFTLGILSLFTNFSSFLSIIIAIGLSFIVNYLLSKYYVFKPLG